MKKVTEVLAEWTPPPRPTYDPGLYPHQYALDFLTGPGGSVIPEEIRLRINHEIMAKPNSRGQERKRKHPTGYMARLMLNAWLKETGEDEDSTYTALADKYLEVCGIRRP
ncbi:hypothetical protein ACFZAM_10440 [Streptomyces sp. NPDC008079]|uniref:hypothetical protein n=1 Tax=Streptomyces sp. NPDC008079 TaxID=3364806 RepID=UPI0036E9B84F